MFTLILTILTLIISLVPASVTTVLMIHIEARNPIPVKLNKYYQDVSTHETTEIHL